MLASLLLRHPAVSTPASRVYLTFYLSLIAISALLLCTQKYFVNKPKQLYWYQFCFIVCYLGWNVLLNSYDLYRNNTGSCLAMMMAIVFSSIIVQFRPQHIILLQSATFTLFYMGNYTRIEDKINATIAVCVAISANILFYYQEIQQVHNRKRITQMRTKLEREQITGAKLYMQRLEDIQKATAIHRHDLRHTLNLVEQFALQGNMEQLQAFVLDSRQDLQDLPPVIFCEHNTVNLILVSFHQRSLEQNVQLTCDVRLPENLSVADPELCGLLFNLLENALHAAQQTDDPALRYIFIKAFVRNHNLVIAVDNGFSGRIRIENERPVPFHPTPNHGIGIESIISIAEHYQGIYSFEADEHVFHAKVMLHL